MPDDHKTLIPLAAPHTALEKINERTAHFGLTLSGQAIAALNESRLEALAATGRVEFGESILPALALAFCDSPHISPQEWPGALAALTEVFYHLKNETGDRLADDTLIEAMRRFFDDPCGGSAEALGDLLTQHIARAMRGGTPIDLAALDPLDNPFAQFYEHKGEDDV